MPDATILIGDVRTRLAELPDGSVQTCITSPPYWGLRDYGHDGQIGLEQTPDAYVAEMVAVFREVRRVLADDGTCWVNLGDSYAASGQMSTGRNDQGGVSSSSRLGPNKNGLPGNAVIPRTTVDTDHGLKPKDLVGIPWRVAFALQADGWWLRQDIIWAKPNPMPESVTDRCTKAHEYLFLLTKSARYYYDANPLRTPHEQKYAQRRLTKTGNPDGLERTWQGQPEFFSEEPQTFGHPLGANKRSVWSIHTQPFPGAHFAVMPEALVEPCVLAGSREGDTILDPFTGSGTVGVVALKHGRHFVGTELNPEYAALAEARIRDDGPLFNEVRSA